MNAAQAQDVTHLLRRNNHYRELTEQHHQLDDRLHELTGKPYLSTSEHVEEITLKKRKLALKDEMEAIARQHLQSSRAS